MELDFTNTFRLTKWIEAVMLCSVAAWQFQVITSNIIKYFSKVSFPLSIYLPFFHFFIVSCFLSPSPSLPPSLSLTLSLSSCMPFVSFCAYLGIKAVAEVSKIFKKKRKPIGAVACCESRMAERIHWWTERWLECRIIRRSIYPFIHLSFLSVYYWSICLLIYLSVNLPISLSIHLLSSLSVYAAVHASSYFCLCVHLSIFLLSTSFFRDLSVSLSLYLSVVLWSIHLSSCLSAHPWCTDTFHPSSYLVLHISI